MSAARFGGIGFDPGQRHIKVIKVELVFPPDNGILRGRLGLVYNLQLCRLNYLLHNRELELNHASASNA